MNKEENVRVELTVHGSVQMVSFRYRVSDIADDLGIVGRIINKPDKTVSIIAEGEKSKIEDFIKRIDMRPLTFDHIKVLQEKGEFIPPQPLARVDRIEGVDRFLTYTGKYNKFEIIPDEHDKELVNSLRTASHLIDRLRTDMYYNFKALSKSYDNLLENIKTDQKETSQSFINSEKIKIDKGEIDAYLLNIGKSSLIILKANNGYVMCGYLNIDTANKLGDIAGKVIGVKTFDDVLKTAIVEVSQLAVKNGFKVGMTGREFLNKLLES